MKRQLRDFGIEGRPAPQTEEETVQSLYAAYQGKSEAELMRALSGMSAEEKAQLSAFQAELAPMLSAAQREKLSAILRALNM